MFIPLLFHINVFYFVPGNTASVNFPCVALLYVLNSMQRIISDNTCFMVISIKNNVFKNALRQPAWTIESRAKYFVPKGTWIAAVVLVYQGDVPTGL
jgi:hypothetical protein